MTETLMFLKLCKYSFKYKTNMVFLLFFLIIGVINEAVTQGTQYLGAFYIVLCSIYVFQFIMSLAMSDMIQSSGIGRRIHVDIPVKLNMVMSLVLYTLVVVFRLIMAAMHPEKAKAIAASLLMIDIMFLVLFIYTAFVYKYFLVSILTFCFTFGFVIAGFNIILQLPDVIITMKVAIIAGYSVILIGAALQYMICVILAKKPISQRAFRGIFKEAK